MDKDETSSDFEYHESEAQDFGQSHGTQHTHAILAVAAGIKELVELLRPLVEQQSEKPRGDGFACAHLTPGGHGSDRCVLPRGHEGLHRLVDGQSWDNNSTTDVKIEHDQRCGHFGPVTDRGAFGVRRPVCNRNPGHPGPHGTGIVGETWLR